MKVLFRFTEIDGKPTEYYGFASGRNKIELFNEIDRYGDPYLTEIIKLDNRDEFSFCVKINEIESLSEDGDEDDDYMYPVHGSATEFEITDNNFCYFLTMKEK